MLVRDKGRNLRAAKGVVGMRAVMHTSAPAISPHRPLPAQDGACRELTLALSPAEGAAELSVELCK